MRQQDEFLDEGVPRPVSGLSDISISMIYVYCASEEILQSPLISSSEVRYQSKHLPHNSTHRLNRDMTIAVIAVMAAAAVAVVVVIAVVAVA